MEWNTLQMSLIQPVFLTDLTENYQKHQVIIILSKEITLPLNVFLLR